MRKLLFATVFLSISLAPHAIAQEYDDEGDSAYGYTSLSFDSSTNQLTGYTETDLDPDLGLYYIAYVSGLLTDDANHVLV